MNDNGAQNPLNDDDLRLDDLFVPGEQTDEATGNDTHRGTLSDDLLRLEGERAPSVPREDKSTNPVDAEIEARGRQIGLPRVIDKAGRLIESDAQQSQTRVPDRPSRAPTRDEGWGWGWFLLWFIPVVATAALGWVYFQRRKRDSQSLPFGLGRISTSQPPTSPIFPPRRDQPHPAIPLKTLAEPAAASTVATAQVAADGNGGHDKKEVLPGNAEEDEPTSPASRNRRSTHSSRSKRPGPPPARPLRRPRKRQ